MTSAFAEITQRLAPTWLTGPIFDKELRVASRRRRNYLLRSIYIAALILFIAMTWINTRSLFFADSPALRAALVAESGRYVVITIIWFQFIVAQLLAVVMLGGAITDEVYHRTLAVLVTTPITSLQIVFGKLSSKLLQTLLLLAISLPLLAIVRVFGGVPWDYVVNSLGITLVATLFAASLALFFSVYSRKTNDAIAKTFVLCLLLYLILPNAIELLVPKHPSLRVVTAVLHHSNPWMAMFFETRKVTSPGLVPPPYFHLWHYAAMLAASVCALTLAVLSIRRVATRQIAGRQSIFSAISERSRARSKQPPKPMTTAVGRIKPVWGHPIAWKEFRIALIRGHWIKTLIGVLLAGSLVIFMYALTIYQGVLQNADTQIGFMVSYFSLALLATASAGASSIAGERQARTWPVLMTLALDEKQVLVGKILGSIMRVWPFWLVLLAHLFVFTLLRCIHFVAIPYLLVLFAASSLLVSTISVFISSSFKRISTAQITTLICIILFGSPICCGLPTFLVSPVTIATIILGTSAGHETALMPVSKLQLFLAKGYYGLLANSVIFVALISIYLLITYVFYGLTHNKLRNKIF